VRICLEEHMQHGNTAHIYHGIMEWFGLEETSKHHLVQTPCNEQRHLPLDQVAQSPVQPDLACFHRWGIYHLCGQPVPVFHHPHHKKILPYIQSKSTLLYFKTITLVLSQQALLKNASPSFF